MFIHPIMESGSVPQATCPTDSCEAGSRCFRSFRGPVCLNAQQWTSSEISFGSPPVFFSLFFFLSFFLSVITGKKATEHALPPPPPPPTHLHSLLPSLPSLETVAGNTKANINMHGEETKPAVAPLKVFQMTRSQSHRCSHTRVVPRRPPPSPTVPAEGLDCV